MSKVQRDTEKRFSTFTTDPMCTAMLAYVSRQKLMALPVVWWRWYPDLYRPLKTSNFSFPTEDDQQGTFSEHQIHCSTSGSRHRGVAIDIRQRG